MGNSESYTNEKSDLNPHRPCSESSQESGDVIIDIGDASTIVNTNSDDSGSTVSRSAQDAEIKYTITRTCKHLKPASYKQTGTDLRAVEDSPIGYSRLAAFESSEPSFSLYRGFGYLHSRVLLELQDEIRSLESDLDDLDEIDHENKNYRRLKSRTADIRDAKREGQKITRRTLIAEIRDKLVKYGTFIIPCTYNYLIH